MTAELGFYDIGLSFAGEDRKYVEDVKKELEKMGHSCFLDNEHRVDFTGENLFEFFGDIYMNRCSFCAMFVSEQYVKKSYPGFERQIIKKRTERDSLTNFMIPIAMTTDDNSWIPFELGRLDKEKDPEEMAKLINAHIVSVTRRNKMSDLSELSDLILEQLGSILSKRQIDAEPVDGFLKINVQNNHVLLSIKPDSDFEYGCIVLHRSLGGFESRTYDRIPFGIVYVENPIAHTFNVQFFEGCKKPNEEALHIRKLLEALADHLEDVLF